MLRQREGLVCTSDSGKDEEDKGPRNQVSGLLDRFGMKPKSMKIKDNSMVAKSRAAFIQLKCNAIHIGN